MATITSTNALARLRTRLDEASAGFWQDGECYSALSDGQRHLINMSLAVWRARRKVNPQIELPVLLTNCFKQTSINLSGVNAPIPADFLDWVNLTFNVSGASGSAYPVFVLPQSAALAQVQANQYLYGDTANKEYFATIGATNIVFNTAGTSSPFCTLTYIYDPIDMSGVQNGVLDDTCQEAIVAFAFAILLQKDERTQDSMAALQEFTAMAQTLTAE